VVERAGHRQDAECHGAHEIRDPEHVSKRPRRHGRIALESSAIGPHAYGALSWRKITSFINLDQFGHRDVTLRQRHCN
jgi:hypothetical protein